MQVRSTLALVFIKDSQSIIRTAKCFDPLNQVCSALGRQLSVSRTLSLPSPFFPLDPKISYRTNTPCYVSSSIHAYITCLWLRTGYFNKVLCTPYIYLFGHVLESAAVTGGKFGPACPNRCMCKPDPELPLHVECPVWAARRLQRYRRTICVRERARFRQNRLVR